VSRSLRITGFAVIHTKTYHTTILKGLQAARWTRRSSEREPSINHPLDLVEGHGVVAAVVEAGGAGGFVAGHLLGDFELAAVLQVGGYAGCTEAVATDFGGDAGSQSPPLNHHVHVGLRQGSPAGELAVPERGE